MAYRSNEEYVWEMNLSGLPNVPDKYKIRGYSKEYSDSLKDDKNFNIVKTFVISLDECREFCKNVAHRVYKPVYWQQITVKIAILAIVIVIMITLSESFLREERPKMKQGYITDMQEVGGINER